MSSYEIAIAAFLFVTSAVAQQTTAIIPSSSAGAQTNAAQGTFPGEKKVLRLEDALELAQKNNPQLRAAAAITSGARAAIQSARAYTNPQFDIQYGHQYGRDIATPGVPGLLQHYGGTQLIEIPRERRTRIEAAKIAAKQSSFGESSALLSVQGEVKRSFYEVLHRKEEVHHAEENLALVEDLRRRVEVQVNVGEVGRLELIRAEAEKARAQTLVKNAQVELVAAIAALRAVIGLSPDASIDPEGNLDVPIVLPPLDVVRQEALGKHPDLAQAQAGVDRAQAVLENQKALRIPQPSLYGEYERQPDLGYYRLGVSVPLPLWNQRKGQIQEAKAAVEVARADVSQRRFALIAALERFYGQYELANQQATVLETASLKQAQSAVEAAQAAYRFGERGIMEVLDAQRVLQSVRGDLLNAQFERQFALINLEQLGAVTIGSK